MARRTVIAVLMVVTFSSLAWGEATREGSGDTARLQYMMQQLNSEKTALAAENTKLKNELRELKDELAAANKEKSSGKEKLGRTAQDLANAVAKGDGLQRAFDTLKGRFDELVEQYRKTAGVLRDVEGEREQLRNLSTDYESRVALCESNNEALYATSLELIDLYERKGLLTVLGQREPVTKLKRIEIENRMDEYRHLADEMRLRYDNAANETGPAGDAMESDGAGA